MARQVAFAMLMVSAVLGCAAQPRDVELGLFREVANTPLWTVDVEKAEPPQGWPDFCSRHPAECNVGQLARRDVALTPATWEAILRINRWANENIRPGSELDLWGSVNKWEFPQNGRGDCKSYVLLKRRMLIDAGFPRQALLITIVWSKEGKGHAVLIARTDKGDFVLDNLSFEVLLAYQTGYRLVKRQSQSDPKAWVYIDGEPRDLTATPLRISANDQ